MKSTTILLIITQFILYAASTKPNNPIVELPLGTVEGLTKPSYKGQDFYAFYGVPYARPPVGKYRFMESVPAKPWIGTLQAKTSYKCLQYNHFNVPGEDKVVGEEDCLYLNVFSPNLDPSANLDVLFYIHGGAFMFNHGSFQGPEYLMDRNIVMVSINYRLGALGFLSTEDNLIPGNMGLKDQNMALKWVQENIKYFGGNPKSVTIVGMSAGGASVQWHYLIPRSKGLFHKGFSQSGVTTDPWVLMEEPLKKAEKLGSLLGCDTSNKKSMVECLRYRPGRQIAQAMGEYQPWMYNPFSPFGVVMDTWSDSPLIPDHPYKLLKNKQVYDVPYISSYTNSEGLYPAAEFYAKEEIIDEIDDRWNELMPHILDFNYTIDIKKHDEISEKIRKEYFNGERLTKKSFPKLVQVIGDRLFLVDIDKNTRLHAAATKSPVYSYYFTHRGAESVTNMYGYDDDLGASHADDTSYMFKSALNSLSTENDRKLSKIMLDMMVSFMKTGKPKMPVEWKPLSKKISDYRHHLVIGGPDNLKMESVEYIGKMNFWDSLPFMENEKLFNVKDEL